MSFPLRHILNSRRVVGVAALPALLHVSLQDGSREKASRGSACCLSSLRILSRQQNLNFFPLPHGHGSYGPVSFPKIMEVSYTARRPPARLSGWAGLRPRDPSSCIRGVTLEIRLAEGIRPRTLNMR